MDVLKALEDMPITYTIRDGWEIHDFITGEIFPVETQRGAFALRQIAIVNESLIWRFSRVRSNERNEWSTYVYHPFICHCCETPLNEDEYNYCEECNDHSN